MARIPLYRDYKSAKVAATIKPGQNVTFSDVEVGGAVEVTINATGGGGGGGGTPASTVVASTSYGQQTAVGTSTDYARADHTHGSVSLPAHSATTGLAWSSSGHTGSSTSIAAWNGNGAAAVVQATSDETMLVRRGGTLQWVAIIASIGMYGGDLVDAGTVLFPNGAKVFSGSIV